MGRLNNFDALRLAGALTVLVGHQFALMGLPVPMVIGQIHIATVAVFVFFAISGYLIAGSWRADPDGFRFLSRRFLRMAPGWFVLTLLSLAVYIGLGITFFPNNPVMSFNGSLWTLEWEILCYVVLGVSALAAGLRVGVAAGLLLLAATWVSGMRGSGIELGLMFAVGAALQAFGIKRWMVALAGAIACLGLLVSEPFLVLLAVVPAASVMVGRASWRGFRSAGRHGDFSYGIYIYAFPVQQFGVMLLGKEQPYLPMLFVSAIITCVLAAMSWHFVEQPALRLKSKLGRDHESPVATQPMV